MTAFIRLLYNWKRRRQNVYASLLNNMWDISDSFFLGVKAVIKSLDVRYCLLFSNRHLEGPPKTLLNHSQQNCDNVTYYLGSRCKFIGNPAVQARGMCVLPLAKVFFPFS